MTITARLTERFKIKHPIGLVRDVPTARDVIDGAIAEATATLKKFAPCAYARRGRAAVRTWLQTRPDGPNNRD